MRAPALTPSGLACSKNLLATMSSLCNWAALFRRESIVRALHPLAVRCTLVSRATSVTPSDDGGWAAGGAGLVVVGFVGVGAGFVVLGAGLVVVVVAAGCDVVAVGFGGDVAGGAVGEAGTDAVGDGSG